MRQPVDDQHGRDREEDLDRGFALITQESEADTTTPCSRRLPHWPDRPRAAHRGDPRCVGAESHVTGAELGVRSTCRTPPLPDECRDGHDRARRHLTRLRTHPRSGSRSPLPARRHRDALVTHCQCSERELPGNEFDRALVCRRQRRDDRTVRYAQSVHRRTRCGWWNPRARVVKARAGRGPAGLLGERSGDLRRRRIAFDVMQSTLAA
jgi:hypothetical protein